MLAAMIGPFIFAILLWIILSCGVYTWDATRHPYRKPHGRRAAR